MGRSRAPTPKVPMKSPNQEIRILRTLVKQLLTTGCKCIDFDFLSQFENDRQLQVRLLIMCLPKREADAARLALALRTADVLESFELVMVDIGRSLGLRDSLAARKNEQEIRERFSRLRTALQKAPSDCENDDAREEMSSLLAKSATKQEAAREIAGLFD